MTSLVSAVTFVPRGFAAQRPVHADVDETEYERIIEAARETLETTIDCNKKSKKNGALNKKKQNELDLNVNQEATDTEESRIIEEYSLDTYDESNTENDSGMDEETQYTSRLGGIVRGLSDLSYYKPGEEDPYLNLNNDESDSERENEEVRVNDNLLLIARTEEHISHVEVCVFDSEDSNLYVHHDFMLPSFPICMEWLDFKPYSVNPEPANFVAVGTMDPEIEIWDLDIVDALWPQSILGSNGAKSQKKKKIQNGAKESTKAKHKITSFNGHSDAVLCLSSNSLARNLLLSCSADRAVKLWDLSNCDCTKTWQNHKGKVSSVGWNPAEAEMFFSAGFDKEVMIFDARRELPALRTKLSSEIECCSWDVLRPHILYAGTASGELIQFDIRYWLDQRSQEISMSHGMKQNFTLKAHDGSISSIACNEHVCGMIATCSADKSDTHIKIWDVEGSKPRLVDSRELDMGQTFSLKFGPDPEFCMSLASGGSKNKAKVWDTSCNNTVFNSFKKRIPEKFISSKESNPTGVVELFDRNSNNDVSDDDLDDNMDTTT